MTDQTIKRLEEMADTLYGLLELSETDRENIETSIQGMQQIEQKLIERIDCCVQDNVGKILNQHDTAFQDTARRAANASTEIERMTMT
jgi:Mg2+ and Co2+ transporter CorA